MLVYERAKNRPYHLGPHPLETLPRDPARAEAEAERPRIAASDETAPDGPLATAARTYRDLFAGMADDPHAPERAPVPDDAARRTADIKGAAYFMNAALVGVCEIPVNAWLAGAQPNLRYHTAVVLLVEHGRVPEPDNLAHGWAAPATDECGDMRATEIAVCIARQIRVMGFAAHADVPGHRTLDAERLAVMAGVAVRTKNGGLRAPFVGDGFSLAVIATEYGLEHDTSLAADALDHIGLAHWWGVNGARSGRERRRQARRASHLSRYPMETVKRVERPTTLINDDEVPRVPKRAAFFERALKGDLGEKAAKERTRFATKHPMSRGMISPIRSMVPLQDGPVRQDADTAGLRDPAANAKAIKALSYFLGSDLTGICEIPRYAWFSHKEDGTEIVPYHRYAVVMLIDQEFETMEGASGDDWISGAQSMRGYLRGAEIAGVMADMLRDLGVPARPQTNVDSDVLHIPLVLWAGLGELSRIGELVLNPFVGPRFKSVVLTTDLPLEPDKPIDFGLQYFCNNCLKCARECPCDAIPFGDKVMFNGYEMWKPDVERCVRYRLTNPHGSACGRCMKTCPINKVIDADGPLLTRTASWLGVNAMWLKPAMVPLATWLDDALGNGKRVAAKKWWLDLEVVGDVTVAPKGTNERDIDPARRVDPAKQKMAYYPASAMPPADRGDTPFPVDRKAAMTAKELLETVEQARARRARGGPPPAHYTPTPPEGTAEAEE